MVKVNLRERRLSTKTTQSALYENYKTGLNCRLHLYLLHADLHYRQSKGQHPRIIYFRLEQYRCPEHDRRLGPNILPLSNRYARRAGMPRYDIEPRGGIASAA